MARQQPKTLEEYVTLRYQEDLNNSGYTPICEGGEELLRDSMDMMARLNMVNQTIRTRVQQHVKQRFGQASA